MILGVHGLGEYTRTITVNPVVQGPPTLITGTAPPFGGKSWWPWVVAAIVIGGVWYLSRERESSARPLGGGG